MGRLEQRNVLRYDYHSHQSRRQRFSTVNSIYRVENTKSGSPGG